MQTTKNSAPAEVWRVVMRLPSFWAERPAVWFAQAEAQFTLAGISSEQTKFYYMISQLERQYASEVEDRRPNWGNGCRPRKKNASISSWHSKWATASRPSFSDTSGPEAPDDFLRSILSSRLQPNVQAILAGQPEGHLNAAAHCADHIIEAASQPKLASVAPLRVINALLQHIEDRSRQVAALSVELVHLRSNSRDPRSRIRNRRSGNRSPSRDDATPTPCWYHRRYGARAQKCTQPCSYRQQRKQK
jgi:hypothetical protein